MNRGKHMNFVFISPNFPHTYWNFCDRLKKNGVNVLGIGDAPYDELEEPLTAIARLAGDANNDNRFNLRDAQLIKNVIAGDDEIAW